MNATRQRFSDARCIAVAAICFHWRVSGEVARGLVDYRLSDCVYVSEDDLYRICADYGAVDEYIRFRWPPPVSPA